MRVRLDVAPALLWRRERMHVIYAAEMSYGGRSKDVSANREDVLGR